MRGVFTGALLCCALLACRDGEPSNAAADTTADQRILQFDTTTVRLATGRDTVPLIVELATTGEQQRLGLMERRRLAERAGMLFVYATDQPVGGGFWMFRTRLPLDIAFLDSAGVVRAIRTMEPCPSPLAQGCPTYEPGVPYRFALEVNAGALARWGVTADGSARVLMRGLPTQRER